MKRGLFIFLAVALLFGIVACNNDSPKIGVGNLTTDKDVYEVNSENYASVTVTVGVEPTQASNKEVVFEYENDKFDLIETDEKGVYKVSFKTTGYNADNHFIRRVKVTSKTNKSAVKYFYVALNYAIPGEKDIAVYDNTTETPTALVDKRNETVLSSIKDLFVGATTKFIPAIKMNAGINMSSDLSEFFTFTSADKSIATIDEDGTITAVSAGAVDITVTSKIPYDTDKFASSTFTVYVNPIRTKSELAAFLSGTNTETWSDQVLPIANQKTAFLVDDITDANAVKVANTKTLDLNGKHISAVTSVSGSLITVNSGTLNIVDNSTETAALKGTAPEEGFSATGTSFTSLFYVASGAELDIDAGTYTATTSGDFIGINNDGTLTVDNAKIDITSTGTKTGEDPKTKFVGTVFGIKGLGTEVVDSTIKVSGFAGTKAIESTGNVTLNNSTLSAIGDGVIDAAKVTAEDTIFKINNKFKDLTLETPITTSASTVVTTTSTGANASTFTNCKIELASLEDSTLTTLTGFDSADLNIVGGSYKINFTNASSEIINGTSVTLFDVDDFLYLNGVDTNLDVSVVADNATIANAAAASLGYSDFNVRGKTSAKGFISSDYTLLYDVNLNVEATSDTSVATGVEYTNNGLLCVIGGDIKISGFKARAFNLTNGSDLLVNYYYDDKSKLCAEKDYSTDITVSGGYGYVVGYGDSWGSVNNIYVGNADIDVDFTGDFCAFTVDNATFTNVECSIDTIGTSYGADAVKASGSVNVVDSMFDVKATGSAKKAFAFMYKKVSKFKNSNITVSASAQAFVSDTRFESNDAKTTVIGGSYSATATGEDGIAVVFGDVTSPDFVSWVPVSFTDATVAAIAERGGAIAVSTKSTVSAINGSFEAVGKDAIGLYIYTSMPHAYFRNTLKNVDVTAKGSNTATAVHNYSTFGNSDPEGINVTGGNYTATRASFLTPCTATVFDLEGTTSSIVVDTATASANVATVVKAAGAPIKKLGGTFTASGTTKTTGIFLQESSLYDEKVVYTECGILPGTIVTATATGTESTATALEAVLAASLIQNEHVVINDGAKFSATAGKYAYGVKFENEKASKVTKEFQVDWYSNSDSLEEPVVSANVTDGEAYALINQAQLNLFNLSDKKDLKMLFKANADNGIAFGIINGILSEENIESLKSSANSGIELSYTGIVNVKGDTELLFNATKGNVNSKCYNYVGKFNTFLGSNGSSLSLVNDGFSQTDEFTHHGGEAYYSSKGELTNDIRLTIRSAVNGETVTYIVPKNTTWENFVENSSLYKGNAHVQSFGNAWFAFDTNNITIDIDGVTYYIASAYNHQVSKNEYITSGDYYVSFPAFIATAEDGKVVTTTYHVEKGSKWYNFVSNENEDFAVVSQFGDAYFGKVKAGEGLYVGKLISYTDALDDATPIKIKLVDFVDYDDPIVKNNIYILGMDVDVVNELGTTMNFRMPQVYASETVQVVPHVGTWNDVIYLINLCGLDFTLSEDTEDGRVKLNVGDTKSKFYEKDLYFAADADTFVKADDELIPDNEYFVTFKYGVVVSDELTDLIYEKSYLTWGEFANASDDDEYVVTKDGRIEYGKGSGLYVGILTTPTVENGFKTIEYVESTTEIKAAVTYYLGMDVSVFNDKYVKDGSVVANELKFSIPSVIPAAGGEPIHMTTWADAITLIGTTHTKYTMSKDAEERVTFTVTDTNSEIHSSVAYIALGEVSVAYEEAVEIASADDEFIPGQAYTVVMPFSIEGLDQVSENFYVRVGSTWADFVGVYKSYYAVDKSFTVERGDDPTATPTVVLGTLPGQKEYRVGLLADRSSYLIDPVSTIDQIEYGKNYRLGLTFKEVSEVSEENGIVTSEYITVLPETTWEQFVGDAAVVTKYDSTPYALGDGPAKTQVTKKIGEKTYHVTENYGQTPVAKGSEIKAVTYYDSARFDIVSVKGEEVVTDTFYRANGTTWGQFAAESNTDDYIVVDVEPTDRVTVGATGTYVSKMLSTLEHDPETLLQVNDKITYKVVDFVSSEDEIEPVSYYTGLSNTVILPEAYIDPFKSDTIVFDLPQISITIGDDPSTAGVTGTDAIVVPEVKKATTVLDVINVVEAAYDPEELGYLISEDANTHVAYLTFTAAPVVKLYFATDAKTVAKSSDLLKPEVKYELSIRFTTSLKNFSTEYYVVPGTTWGEFATAHPDWFTVESYAAETPENKYFNNAIVAGKIGGTDKYHVGFAMDENSGVVALVTSTPTTDAPTDIAIIQPVDYSLGLSFKEVYGTGVNDYDFVTVLPGTTWSQLVSNDSLKTYYSVDDDPGKNVFKKVNTGTGETIKYVDFYVSTDYGRTPVKKGDVIVDIDSKGVTYYDSLKFYITTHNGMFGYEETKEYYIQNGQTWNDFANSENGFCVDTTNLVPGWAEKTLIAADVIGGADVAHIFDGNGAYVNSTTDITRGYNYYVIKLNNAHLVTVNDTTWGVEGKDTWYVAYKTANIAHNITCKGDVHLMLLDDCDLTVTANTGKAGISVDVSGEDINKNSLTIYSQSYGEHMGKLTSCGGYSLSDGKFVNAGAGIGGNPGTDGGNITINGGNIIAVGGSYSHNVSETVYKGSAAGIGGGANAKGKNICINGGKVTATAGAYGGDGIGNGAGQTEASNIIISTKLVVKAGTSSASSTISNSGTDLSSSLKANRYVTVGL